MASNLNDLSSMKHLVHTCVYSEDKSFRLLAITGAVNMTKVAKPISAVSIT
jgi:hypothetical protein